MKSVPFTAHPRTLVKRTGVKKLRSAGRIPAVVYGKKSESKSLEIDEKELSKLMKGSVSENILVELDVAGDKSLALVKDVQRHPLKTQPLHVDFQQVAEDQKVTLMVPIETVGEAAGVKTGGGVLEHVLFRTKVMALPKDLPEFIDLDVSNMQVGQTIHLGEIPAIEGVTLLGNPKIPVCSIAQSRADRAAKRAAGESAAAEGEEAAAEAK